MKGSIKDLPGKSVGKDENLEQQLRAATQFAYSYAVSDPASSLNNARKATELICRHLIVEHKLEGWKNPVRELEKMLKELRDHREIMPRAYEIHATMLQNWGNFGSHPNGELTSKEVISAMLALKCLTDWFCELKGFSLIPLTGSFSKAFQTGKFEDALKTIIVPTDSRGFIAEITKNPRKIRDVGMMFHAGAEWRNENEKVDLIKFMVENKIPLRVIVNDAASVRNICPHMHMKDKEYIGFRRSLKRWRKAEKASKGFIHVRVSTIPMLHRIYLLRYKNHEGAINVKYYTYGNDLPAKDYRVAFTSDTHEYQLYSNEFDYIWKRALPIRKFTIFNPIARIKHFFKSKK